MGRGRARGQAMVELLIAAPVVFFMILMIVQMVLLYRIKSTLDYAALMTARAGAVSGLKRGDMQAAFAKGMMPLYAHKTGMAELETAYAKARADLLLFGDITVVNPTRAAWNEFKERQYNGQYALPNDSLAYRSHAVGSSGVSVQDANLLKVKLTYDAPLVVPFVGWVLGGKSQYLKAGTFESSPLTTLTRRLRVESYAIVRMQSPIYESQSDMLAGGSSSGSSGGGSGEGGGSPGSGGSSGGDDPGGSSGDTDAPDHVCI
ncbi:TadE/TadG family type IV pilus assembly protein [Thermomonas brevis]